MFSLSLTRSKILRVFALLLALLVLLGVMALQVNARTNYSNSNGVKSVSNFKQPEKVVSNGVKKTRNVRKRTIRKAKFIKRVSRANRSKTRTLRPPVRRSSARTIGKSRGLNPRLRYLLTKIRLHYGRSIIITSGCRSYRHNRRVGGARRSMHLKCMAADIKVSGVSKSSLRRYVASLSGRGGVGTYCGRSIVHLDVGERRSWYYGCGKRRKKSRRKA